MAASIRTSGMPSASPSIIPRLVPELLFVGAWVALAGAMVVTWVTVEMEPSVPVVVDSCVTVAAVCDSVVVGEEELTLDVVVCASALYLVLDLV